MTRPKRDMSGQPKRLLDYQGVAHYLSISVANVKELARQGEFVKVPMGARVLFDIADVDAFIERKKKSA